MEAQPRLLLEAEHVLPCGYAPRTLLQSLYGQSQERVFLGCKDGSLAVTERSEKGFRLDRLAVPPKLNGGLPRGVRTLRELDESHLLVGRSDGAVELVAWKEAKKGKQSAYHPLLPPGEDPEDSVRYIQRRDDLWLISWRSRTHLYTWDEREQRLLEKEELRGSRTSDLSLAEPLRGVRVAVPYMERSPRWLLATSRGELWTWEKIEGATSDLVTLVYDLWPPGETPGFIDDFALIRDPRDPFQTIFLSSDLGVYASGFGFQEPQTPVRVSLPGLGAVCMALSAVSTEPENPAMDSYDFLWAADAQGDSHLFWRKSGYKAPPFRPSGIVHVGYQVMLAISWRRSETSLVFAQARRNDAIAFSEYTVVPPATSLISVPAGPEKLRRFRHLLLYGSADELRQEAQAGAEWPAWAVLADFFEWLSTREEDGPRALKEFLSNPSAACAFETLKDLERGESFFDEVGTAVRHWVLTLLGIVNRMKDAGETPYLGIVRWLRDLELQAHQARQDEALGRALLPPVRKAIRFTRKWGLFGQVNSQRRHLVKPLEVLRSQLSDPQGDGRLLDEIGHQAEAIDLLTYETLLFHRSSDVLLEDLRGEMRGRSAWDMAILEDGPKQIAAISWMWGGVELYDVKRGPNGAIELDLQLALVADPAAPEGVRIESYPEGASRTPSSGWQVKHGYSRAVYLGRAGGHRFLLTAPTLGDRIARERIHLWQLTDERHRLNATPCSTDERACLSRGESVYRFLRLQEGKILAGLRGTGGLPRLALLAVRAGSSGLSLEKEELELSSSGVWRESSAQNRVWSLARALPRHLGKEPLDKHRIAVGCESGDILQFQLARDVEPKDVKDGVVDVEQVAQMGSSVVSLAYLRGYSTGRDGKGGEAERIFAGGEDGAIVAWQKLAGKDGGFTSLWATVERGPVAAIFPVPYGDPGPHQEPLVLAVTRMGRCAVFDDRARIEPPARFPEHKWQPQRPRFPGKRLRRPQLGGTAFASEVLCRLAPTPEDDPVRGEKVWQDATGRYAVLLTASESGKIRLASLHYPQSLERQAQYDRVLDLFWKIIFQDRQYDRLRLVDAAYQSAPLLPLIVVRWLLEPEEGRRKNNVKVPDPPEPEIAWKMPRYLRPLLELRTAWQNREAKRAAEALDDLLLQAWRREDVALFQQLCAVTLKRANFAICQAAEEGDSERQEEVCGLYLGIFDVIERSLQRWLGAPDRQETRVRIMVAKNLVDGDTFLHVLRQAAKEKGREGPFQSILGKLVEGVRQLVFKHDSLLSLETFRALNLSLTRLCGRLMTTAGPHGRREEVPWPVFAGYFEAVAYAAARTFRSRLELNDSLAHEYCRTFALAVCACPSAAIRIANRITETQRISDPDSDQDLSHRVIRQFDVLAQIGLPVLDHARRLFEMASCPPQKELNPVRPVLKNLGLPESVEHPRDRRVIAKVGAQNAEDLYCLSRLYTVVDWFIDLGERLSTDAKGIDLTEDRIKELSRWLLVSNEDPLALFYPHSLEFWQKALAELGVHALAAPSRNTIRPDMILCSRNLAAWASRQIGALHRSYRDLEFFQPEYSIFREVLARLERAAQDFPSSAAVQKNLVAAVFGHHLLEVLDEHVFELEELAQNLDPLLVWEFRDKGRIPTFIGPRAPKASENGPVAQRFAEYLLRRASHAESVPKNLRALYGILEPTPGGQNEYPVEQLFRAFEAVGWEPRNRPNRWAPLDPRAFQFLSLTLAELESNNQKHSGLMPRQKPPQFSYSTDGPPRVELQFWFQWDEQNVERLLRLSKSGLQAPLPPREDSAVASTGAGLYLANLAASVVDWQLQINKKDPIVREEDLGMCRFDLVPGTERRAPR